MIEKKHFELIRNAFFIYDKEFNNYEFTYTYKHRLTKKNMQMKIVFTPGNFMHLCGVKYDYSATQFYKAIKRKKISLKKIHVQDDGSTGQKLQIIHLLELLSSSGVRICDNGPFYNLSFDKAIRTSKMIIALTCVRTENQYAPQSLLALNGTTNKNLSKSLLESHEVVKIEKVKIGTNDISKTIFEKTDKKVKK